MNKNELLTPEVEAFLAKYDLEQRYFVLVPEDHYIAESCRVECFDWRFQQLYKKHCRTVDGHTAIDRVIRPGAAKTLADAYGRDWHTCAVTMNALEEILVSIVLHKAPEVVLSLHEACGAYAGRMPTDTLTAIAYMYSELTKAVSVLREFLVEIGHPEVRVRRIILTLNLGVLE